jgi:hypothetical protein
MKHIVFLLVTSALYSSKQESDLMARGIFVIEQLSRNALILIFLEKPQLSLSTGD